MSARFVMEAAEVETRSFSVRTSEIGLIDDWVAQVGARWQASERTVFGARLCVAELAANVLEHGVATVGDDRIMVTLRRCPTGIAIEFVDTRLPFDPTGDVTIKTAASVAELEPGGRGLRLLHAYADALAYHRDGIRNRVTFEIRGP